MPKIDEVLEGYNKNCEPEKCLKCPIRKECKQFRMEDLRKEADGFFHSGCCKAHFDGVVLGGKKFIVCEKCGRFCGIVPDIK